MKNTLLFPFLLLCISSIGQSRIYHFAEEFYFVKEIAVTNYKGKSFRYEIAVKSTPADTLSKIRIHGIASGKGKEDFIKSNFKLESRIEQDWTIYTIIGQVQEQANSLLFYASINGNGDFYFDDVNFYVEEKAGKWKQLELYNPSFELNKPNIFAGYYVSKRRTDRLRIHLSEHVFKTGRRSLNVTTYGNIPVTGIVKQVINQTPQTAEELSFHQEFVEVAPDLMIFRAKKESLDKGPLVSKSQTK
jgi:hypothetical protein